MFQRRDAPDSLLQGLAAELKGRDEAVDLARIKRAERLADRLEHERRVRRVFPPVSPRVAVKAVQRRRDGDVRRRRRPAGRSHRSTGPQARQVDLDPLVLRVPHVQFPESREAIDIASTLAEHGVGAEDKIDDAHVIYFF